MLGIAGLFVLAAGTGLSYAAHAVPARRKSFERCGGTMLIAGLVMAGSALPFV